MLRDGARRYVGEQSFETNRRSGGDIKVQRGQLEFFAEMGWLSVLVSEDDGGLGWSMQDIAILSEEFGRGLMPSPIVSGAVIGPRLVSASTLPSRNELLGNLMQGAELIALAHEESQSRYDLSSCHTQAQKTDAGYRLRGRKILVQDGAVADRFLVTARLADDVAPSLFLVPAAAEGLHVSTYPTIDGRLACDLLIENVELGEDSVVLPAHRVMAQMERTLDEARVALAAEALGLMEASLALTRGYLTQRKQFGRVLSDFQVLTHRLADMYVTTENARAMLYRVLSLLDAEQDARCAAVSATMKTIIDAGEFVCGQAIQLHGGIGMTDEYVISHYYRRLRSIALAYGDPMFHAERYREWSLPKISPAQQCKEEG